jgi:NAD(P)-dependent dehydrogenase (short-subunit alcohol dehydrogenase family)
MKRDKTWTWRRVDAGSLMLGGLNVAVIGGTGGIGRAMSRFMAARGANVVVVGQTFRDTGASGIEFIKADLSLMREAKRIGELLPAETMDLIVFTTGIFAAPHREETAEGIERDMAISYLSRLVIIRHIGSRLGTRSAGKPLKPRVFIMGYPGVGQTGAPDDLNAEKSYRAMTVHMNTVAGNEMLVLNSAKRYPNASFFGLNPGVIQTNIRSNFLGAGTLRHRFIEWMIGLTAPGAAAYAEGIAPLLVSPDLEGHSGAMFDRKGYPIIPSPKLTGSHMRKFIAASEALVSRAKDIHLH